MIESLLDRKEIPYLIKGNDCVITCLNPEHEDNSPSLRIDRTTGLYYCFSCSFKGGLVDLLRLLGEPDPTQSLKLQVKVSMLKKKLQKAPVIDVVLPEDREAVTTFRGISRETLNKLKVFTVPGPHELANRVCIPIYYRKRVKFIEARTLQESVKPKYLRYPEDSDTGFILSENCGAPMLVLVEGVFDYIKLIDLGVKNVTPLFGLSFSYIKAKHIHNMGFIGVIDMMDNDTAGLRASTNIEKMCGYNNLLYKRLKCATDPGDLEPESFKQLIDNSDCTIVGDYLV